MFWFVSAKPLRKDVGAMVAAFAEACPPPAEIGNRPVSVKEVGDSLEVLYAQAAAYARSKRLSFLGRARLAKALQDEMRQREYSDELVSRVVNAVTVNALVAPDRH